MDFIFEATDFTKVKLSVYERFNSGEITESEKDALINTINDREIQEALITEAAMMDSAAMLKIAGIAAGAVAASAALVGLIMKVASMLKVRDKIKASTELTKINNDIKKCNTQLKKTRSDLSTTINKYRTDIWDANQRANFYGSRMISSTTTTRDWNTGEYHYGTTTQYNPQYDKEKSDAEKKKAEELRKIVSQYTSQRDELKKEIKELKALKSRFMAVVRNNLEDAECESIKTELERIMQSMDVVEA